LLKGRGALQDIDQLSVMASITKWAVSITKVSSIQPTVEKALDLAQDGVPGPVFLEIPIDVLYPEEMVREMFMNESGVKDGKNLGNKALELYMRGHLYRQFHQPHMSEGRVTFARGRPTGPGRRESGPGELQRC